ncbi:MAG: arsenosugar biosynthesis radical SAM (seleno)protein ArsS [Thermodesulfobacteriota bacterium]
MAENLHKLAKIPERAPSLVWEERLRTPAFYQTLLKHQLKLVKDTVSTLQINVGLLCNQACRHCHLEAGAGRREIMSPRTMDQVTELARKGNFKTIDITGGAPEMHPQIDEFVGRLAPCAPRLIFRSNLTALALKGPALMELLKRDRVIITASFPSLNEAQSESVRGRETFQVAIDTLKRLNRLGYGQPQSGLELNLVSNPAGAFLPPSQAGLEKRFHDVLAQKYGIVFNSLFSFANAPLGRFRSWLIDSGNFAAYIDKLAAAFNPCTVNGLMCRSMLSVAWDGHLYDCDFNQAAGLPLENQPVHVSHVILPVSAGRSVAVGYHCYTCTAGSGFT